MTDGQWKNFNRNLDTLRNVRAEIFNLYIREADRAESHPRKTKDIFPYELETAVDDLDRALACLEMVKK